MNGTKKKRMICLSLIHLENKQKESTLFFFYYIFIVVIVIQGCQSGVTLFGTGIILKEFDLE